MSKIVKGRNVRVEVARTYGPSKVITDVDSTTTGIAHTTQPHGLAYGSVGYFDDVEGMAPLDGQAIRVAASASPPSANAFGLENINTSDFPDWISGMFVPVTAWATLSQSTQYALGGGAPKTEDVTTLLDTREQQDTIQLAAETVTIDIRSLEEDNDALLAIRESARKLVPIVFRITLNGGAQRVFRGQPSLPGESLAQSATGTGQLTVTVKGQIAYLPAL